MAKAPRKRKMQRFEVRLMGETPLEAKQALNNLIKNHKLRDVQGAKMQLWGISEIEFIDHDGSVQTLVMRNVCASGSAIAIDLA